MTSPQKPQDPALRDQRPVRAEDPLYEPRDERGYPRSIAKWEALREAHRSSERKAQEEACHVYDRSQHESVVWTMLLFGLVLALYLIS